MIPQQRPIISSAWHGGRINRGGPTHLDALEVIGVTAGQRYHALARDEAPLTHDAALVLLRLNLQLGYRSVRQ